MFLIGAWLHSILKASIQAPMPSMHRRFTKTAAGWEDGKPGRGYEENRKGSPFTQLHMGAQQGYPILTTSRKDQENIQGQS